MQTAAVVMIPTGEMVTLTSLEIDVPQHITQEQGSRSRVKEDITGKCTIKTETIILLAAPLLAAGISWQEMPAFDFGNIDVSPDGEIPLEITLENVQMVMTIPSFDLLKGGPVEWECPLLIGNAYINGVPVLREPRTLGI